MLILFLFLSFLFLIQIFITPLIIKSFSFIIDKTKQSDGRPKSEQQTNQKENCVFMGMDRRFVRGKRSSEESQQEGPVVEQRSEKDMEGLSDKIKNMGGWPDSKKKGPRGRIRFAANSKNN